MNIAIFGGGGFIGRHLVETLSGKGHNLYIIGRTEESIENAYYINCNTCEDLYSQIKDCSIIVDLVYATNPKTSFDDPINDIQSNLPITIERFELALKLKKLEKYIFVSSGGTVYGESHTELISENHVTNPISPYGITKLAIEKYGLMYAVLKKLPFIIARPSNAYGMGQKVGTGQGFIMAAIHSILMNKEIFVFGENGTVRDYIHVKDLAAGLESIVLKGGIGETYNIGSGVGYSNLEVVQVINRLLEEYNRNLSIKNLKPREFDVKHNVLNCNKLRAQTIWLPKISLEEGLSDMLKNYLKQQ
jgi:UDP-glucose 4-epimerase